ncbi:MAG: tRNA pseudouridine(38-40) synthase TruA [Fimbriimonadaceae bacterium]
MSTNSRRIKLVVSYDGTDFCGWAAQPGQRTVQSTLTEAVRRITGEDSELYGASRTDSGAHAAGQVAHFDCGVPVPSAKWPGILNRLLPNDLRIVAAEQVENLFHSRFSAKFRSYRYTVIQDDTNPFRGRYAYVHLRKLNITAMKAAAEHLVGEHDFVAFTEELPPELENTKRELYRVDVTGAGDEVRIDVDGTAFMRGMMRRISGFLLEVGRGRRSPEDTQVLLGPDRATLQWPVVLPAKGLCLRGITY